ncbi:GNAT family N-acetyltransferase [Actinoplanes sp. NEAU-A12]|uniref:GNAT family N-acetyltransferase n=1 Tax=Actinoplanes sandaracinus TaxID=3045177 RepID=A0ABT6WZQ9_9ACTN|nr:GNAT family N-acetyltransferase [Actinoplanes sandaracinus]MDI6105202.1 GNAT family N-acetyltransferase [Actinoplanes sandaracinus]
MSTLVIRPAAPADAPAVVALRASVYPYLVRGERAVRAMIESPPAGEERASFVAVTEPGRVVGWVVAHRELRVAEPGFGRISLLHVHAAHRRRGIGNELFGAAREHLRGLGVSRVATIATAEAVGFARRHGFAPTREIRYSALELSALPDLPVSPAQIRLVPLSEVDEATFYEADMAAATDEPGDAAPQPMPYESWRRDVWENPDLDFDASTVAVMGTKIASFSLVLRDGDRVWSEITATVPQYRGRGLALLVKTAALHRAAAVGAKVAYTSNDESNLPMLAVNVRLGYRPVATQFSCTATLPTTI